MPRNGAGVYSKPAGTTAVTLTSIASAKYNETIDDLVSDANNARPIVAGGTGGITAVAGADNLSTKGTDIPSATTTDIGAATGRYVHITGTTTITGLGTKTAGVLRIVTFDGVLTLTHNATSLILPGAANIITAAGDVATLVSEGGGNWRCVAYSRASGGALVSGAYTPKSGNYTAVDGDYDASIRFSAAATLSIDVTANLRTNWRARVWADGGQIVIDPNSTDTINGTTTLVLQQGQKALIYKTGSTTFQADVYSDALAGPQIQGYASGLALTTNATDATNDVDIAVGVAAADVSPYNLMQLTSALTKRLDASWAVGTNQGGLDTGAVGNNTYYIWLIQRSDTGVVDVLFSLSATAPTMPTNYDRKRLLGLLVRASATNSTPYLNAKSIGNTGLILLSKGAIPGTAAVDWTVPSGPHRYVLVLSAFSTNGTGVPMLQLKTGGSAETSGYSGGAANSGSASGLANSSGFYFNSGNSASLSYDIVIELILLAGNAWVFRVFGSNSGPGFVGGGGGKTLAGPIDGLRLTTPGAVNVPDSGDYALYAEY